MSYGQIRYDKTGNPYIVMEFRRVHPATKEKIYHSKKEYLDVNLTAAKLKKQADNLDFEFIKQCEKEMFLGVDSNSLTYAEFCDIYFKYAKENLSLSTVTRLETVSEYVIEEIGHIKLKNLTPEIIENFISKVNQLTKKVEQYYPKANFNQLLEEKGLTYHKMRREMKIQHATLTKAMKGENVGKLWAEKFSQKVKIPVEKLFEIKKEEVEIAFNTKKKYTSFLKASLSYAVRKRYISENYATANYVESVKNKEPNKKTKCMNKEKFLIFHDYVLNYPDIRIKTAFVLLLNTGMRKEELMGLKWENILFHDRKIIIESTVVYVQGKGTFYYNKTKNSSSTRVIAVADEVIDVLKDYQHYCNMRLKKSEFLFIREDGKFISPSTINLWLNRLLDELGFEHYTVHSLRHSYASIMIEETPSLIAVSKRIGHSRVSTTTDIYGHVISNNDREIANALKNEKDSPIIEYLKQCVKNGTMTIEAYNEAIKKI